MSEVLSVVLQSMQHDSQRMDRIANNIANALTPGFKREVVAVSAGQQSFPALVQGSGVFDYQLASQRTSSVEILRDSKVGTLKSTNQSLDVALMGEGYFEIQTENTTSYTRQGNFKTDSKGRLVTSAGHPVMGKNGEIYIGDVRPQIDQFGNIFDSSNPVGRLQAPIAQIKVVQFDRDAALDRFPNGMMQTQASPNLLPDDKIQIRQGFLENSNVNNTQEMIQLMQTMRHFESMQRVALGYDEMMGSAIRRLGELS
jgi:flagellar basal-body rod protein FlgF